MFKKSDPKRSESLEPGPRPSRLPVGLSALSHRNYRLFFFGQLISVTGTWMQTMAQAWLVLKLTGSAFDLGLINVFQFAPVLVLGLVGGVLADRFPKRTVLVITQASSGMLSAILGILVFTNAVQLWHVYALALALGIVKAFDMPTRQAFVVEMVGKEDLVNAVALNSAVFNAARLIGPALAGIVLGVVGIAACFGVDAISYLAVIAGLLMMRIEPFKGIRPRAGIKELREGLAYVKMTPAVLLPIAIIGFMATFALNFKVWLPLLAENDFHIGASGFGLLYSMVGAGSLVGALFIAFIGREPRRSLMLVTAVMIGVLEVGLAVVSAIPLSLVFALLLLPGMGFCNTTTSAMANTLVQMITPDHLRGRVMSVYTTVFGGTAPFGSLMTGSTAKLFGTPVSIAIGGIITAIATIIAAMLAGVLRHPSTDVQPPAAPTRPSVNRQPAGSRVTTPSSVSTSGND
jgi:MFS family permease